jgi:predicted DCC family thiol-disulfide oxidoreductase YuxK
MLLGMDRLFYDGDCGLCHGAVRFVVQRDRRGSAFRYAPLGGSTFERLVPVAQRATLADSLVVLTSDRQLLARSEGVIYVLKKLGGIWPLVGSLLEIVPSWLRNAGYDWIARHRLRLFEPPVQSCPVPSGEEQGRFDS